MKLRHGTTESVECTCRSSYDGDRYIVHCKATQLSLLTGVEAYRSLLWYFVDCHMGCISTGD